MDTKVTVTEDLAAIKYFAQNNDKMLLSQLVFAMPYFTDDSIRKILQLRSPINLPKYSANNGWRPLDESVEVPVGEQGQFSKRVLTGKTGMKILQIRPQQYKQTFFADLVGPNAKNLPSSFAPYFWDAQNKQSASEITRGSFLGVDPDSISAYSAVATYSIGDRITFTKTSTVGEQYWEAVAATSAGESPSTDPAKWTNIDNRCLAKGIGTILKEEYSGLPATQKIAVGAHTSANMADHMKTMWRSLPDELKSGPGKWVIYCSISNGEKYIDHVQDKYYTGVTVEEAKMMTVRGSNGRCYVKPVEWMGSFNGLILTQEKNIVAGTDLAPDFTSIGKMIEDLHGYKTIQKAVLGFQIADLEIVYLDDSSDWTS